MHAGSPPGGNRLLNSGKWAGDDGASRHLRQQGFVVGSMLIGGPSSCHVVTRSRMASVTVGCCLRWVHMGVGRCWLGVNIGQWL